jgi:hypothetical protein
MSTLSNGQVINFLASNDCPASANLQIQTASGTLPASGGYAIQTSGGVAVAAGAFKANDIVTVIYNSMVTPNVFVLTSARRLVAGDAPATFGTGANNVGWGPGALSSNTTGLGNVGLGYNAGTGNTTGSENCFVGYEAGNANVDGNENCVIGYQAGYNNGTGGNENCFLGYRSGFTNATGTTNSFVGAFSGYSNTASENSFFGYEAGYATSSGGSNHSSGMPRDGTIRPLQTIRASEPTLVTQIPSALATRSSAFPLATRARATTTPFSVMPPDI